MIYKRDVNKIEEMRHIEYVLSNNIGSYMNTSVIGSNFAPYHGLFIQQQPKNDQILLSKLTEKLDFGSGEEYSIMDYKTSENVYGGSEYLVSFETNPFPKYKYEINGCCLEKRYKFVKNENVLCIDYLLENNTNKFVRFSVSPMVTKRGLFDIKREGDMKFTVSSSQNTFKVNLSISENMSLYMKAPSMKFNKSPKFEKGVNFDLEVEPGKIRTYVEDLFIPGTFEAVVKAGHTATLNMYVSLADIEERKFDPYKIEQECLDSINDKISYIDDSFVELKSMAQVAYLLHYVDFENKKLVLLESIPVVPEGDEYIKNIISSIEGNYLALNRYKEAVKILECMMSMLKCDSYNLNPVDKCEAELLFIEAVNRYIQESECRNSEVKDFYEYIKQTLYKYIEASDDNCKMDKDFLLKVSGKKYIKINALWYNALRILIFLQDKYYEASEYIYSISENVRNNIVEKFWVSDKSVLKYEINEEPFSNFDMMYTLSLSYPALHEKVAMKLIDTTFKELYTPLGMRKACVGSKLYDGFVYPHLMVHFLKANLRQMGVTRATQKLGYNLVKDIFAEINKEVVGTVRYKYCEKSKKAYGFPINALTNAELIRMFDMLT